ncbi:Nucleotidyltransferase [Fomitiporia mediterranea MF3/22]|uniref:Nucleotidyltransferase n=1 Tax=Fomitiporia mediterranea (strain MF3/22) TaxID=694068 RepID=UPI0004408947|nr:Nucleotidyltransferase [Fomitiporia mediterranea MF3/22]EJD04833.1 Nucleotidyltransferase [Fomitiporia mediterranea MF3/22]
MTPREYAIRVQSKFAAYLEKTSSEKLPLRGKAIFYIGGDYNTASQTTRKRMDLLRKKGATVVPTYDPNVITHIVTEGNARVTLKALGLKSLGQIPLHIPTLTWKWVSEGTPDSPEFWFAAFSERIDASSDKTPDRLRDNRRTEPEPPPTAPVDQEFSRIEDFTIVDDKDERESDHASTSKNRDDAGPAVAQPDNDPLAEFYDQARKDAATDRELSRTSDRSSDDNDDEPDTDNGRTKSKWTCDNVPVGPGMCVNQDIVDKLSELEEINRTKISGDPREQRWRVFSYGKSIRAIRAHPKRIRNYEDAIAIRGIGSKTAAKIVEIIKTGDLGRIKYDNTEDVQAIKLFNNIYGVGLSTAQKWYSMGCRTLDDVKNRKGGITVSDVQEIGLKYYDDINTRIPRGEVEEIFNRVKLIALEIDPKLFFLLMGSYRRGAKSCGDIDILMTRPTDDGRTHQGVLRRLLKELHLQGILTEDLAIPEDFNDLEQTYRGLCRKDDKSPRRRIDILVVPYHERGGALIYYTGDDIFNRAIRLKAKSMGYSLSQHGLATRVLRDHRGKKMVPADLVASETEEQIFHILGVPWQEPHERIRAMTS